MADAHTNFAYSSIVGTNQGDTTNPGTGTTLTVQAGNGAKFPPPPFNATVWPAASQPVSTNAEIVRVTDIDDDTFTILRQQEGSASRSLIVGDQIAASLTAKTLTDAEATPKVWSPFILASGAASGLQTLASTSNQSSTGSLFVFPVTVPQGLIFNQLLLANSLSFVSSNSNETAGNSYYSKYGIYSMNANTLSLISSSSFSIGETISSGGVKLTWNFPVATATANTTMASGWSYGSFSTGNLTALAQISSYVMSTRLIGLQFGGNLTLTGGQYWIGLMSQRSTVVRSNIGLSLAGIIGQPIANINQAGTVSGLLPIGMANSNFSGTNASHVTQWWGRYIMGFVTATSLTEQGGSAIPGAISLSYLAGFAAASTATILPSVTFVST